MEEYTVSQTNTRDTDPEIDRISKEIVELISPAKILLFNAKFTAGGLSSFKLCIVKDVENGTEKTDLERKIYIHVDSEIPFDILIYTRSEWEELSRKIGSFANKITQIGRVIYG